MPGSWDDRITFCVLTMHRTPWLKRSISSIQRYCPVPYHVRILSQGYPDAELAAFLTDLDGNFEVTISPINLGCGEGRRLLSERVVSPYVMMLDDDMYLTENSVSVALEIFKREATIGAVNMPQFDLQGNLVYPGGRHLAFRNGVMVMSYPRVELHPDADFIEVDDLAEGGIIYRNEMRGSFSYDPRLDAAFEDLDRSMQILTGSNWKQAIATRGKIVHDRSWLAHDPAYEAKRFDALRVRRNYKYFCSKWRVRFDLRSHILLDFVFPTLTLMRCQWLMSPLNIFVQMRGTRRYRRQSLLRT